MPRAKDLKRVLIIGSGPIVIGQACEFDYSGTQACKALMKEGLEVILVNSNPATIMTDPEIATRVYVEPLNVEFLERIIEKERPDAVIPTLGGQTALNLALALDENGILSKYQTRLLGANPEVIKAAEDREIFRSILDKVGAKYPKSHLIRTFEAGLGVSESLGFPIILRPNYTLGGGGGGIAYNLQEYQVMLAQALHESPTSEVLVEESILGWKEFELEVMRDAAGSFVVVCTIENFDPCGVHTGDSITVAPQQTLSDSEYQAMRDEACRIIQEVGVQTGGANIQFAVHPATGERVVIEMNPRVSRSSALASKATGFPIAKIAALLSIGYTLDEIPNDITKVTPSCYEPALDYVVVKIPRFAFEKFSGARDELTTQMKSVGEVMGLGRTFKEAFHKAVLSLEFHKEGFPDIPLQEKLIAQPNSKRLFHLYQALRLGRSMNELSEMTQIHPWFLEQLEDCVRLERQLQSQDLNRDLLLRAKRFGFSDALIARLKNLTEVDVRSLRVRFGLFPQYLNVDTCAGEFASSTPYFYSTYWSTQSAFFEFSKPALVIGSGPNRIGQGIEFDYSCVRGVKALRRNGIQVVMVNSNPETVSTDYDTADALFFEPLTEEHLIEVSRFCSPRGFLAQLGGQTPIQVAPALVQFGIPLMGSDLESIDLAEDRKRFSKVCRDLDLKIPESLMATCYEEALEGLERFGFPVICRPSYVLGGRRMEVIESKSELQSYFQRHADFISVSQPCLVDQFLEGALEVDVDLVRGKDWIVIGGIIEHIEAAGIHSGDSMGVLPPQRLKESTCQKIQKLAAQLANQMNVIGHLNLQVAIKDDQIFILEANPRSSRSVPFIAKATGIPLIDLGVDALLGKSKQEVQPEKYNWESTNVVCVKGVVFPFKKFKEADSILGPEMKSTGEAMGRGRSFSEAMWKALVSSQVRLPHQGEVFFSCRDKDKKEMFEFALEFKALGYQISATQGTADFFNERGLQTTPLKKVHEGRPHCVDHILSGQVAIVINTTRGKTSIEASFAIRRACIDRGIPCVTENDAVGPFLKALRSSRTQIHQVSPL